MDHPDAKLDHNRQELINNALNLGYNATLICNAITGCSLTSYNMGNNDRGERHDGLHIILRDANQIDRFINHYSKPHSHQAAILLKTMPETSRYG